MASVLWTKSQETHSACRAALPEYIVYEVSFDETTEDMVVDGDKGPQHVMMIQGKISYCYDDYIEVVDAVVPITILAGITAEHLLRALKTRVPAVVEGFAALGIPYCIVLNSDSAKACKRLARHFQALAESQPDRMHLHSRCQQHMVSASLVSVASMFDLTNGSFCATLQLHKGSTMKSLRDGCEEHIRNTLEVTHVWDEAWNENYKMNKSVLSLLLQGDFEEDSHSLSAKACRDQSAQLLLQWLPELWCKTRGRIRHYCPVGCCKTFEESVYNISLAFRTVLLGYRPKVPALNRWLGLYAPLAWWVVAHSFFSIVPLVFCKVEPDWRKVITENSVLTLGEIYGEHNSELAYKTKERTRWRKAVKWMTGDAVMPHITLFVMLISPALDAMTCIFQGEDSLSAIDFVHKDTNPAARAIHRYFGLLHNQEDRFWLPWVAHTQFDDEGLLLALKVIFSLVGALFLRSILVFRSYPWRLARLVHPLSTEAEREKEKSAFCKRKCKRCLDSGFSQKVWSWLQKGCSWATILKRLRRSFKRCPVSNVPIEVKFARQRTHNSPCMGRLPNHSTVGSNHYIAEVARLHNRKLQRRQHLHCT